jgi:hypothetical protein
MASGAGQGDQPVSTARKWPSRIVFFTICALYVTSLFFTYLARNDAGVSQWGTGGPAAQIVFGVVMFSFPLAGGLITWRKAENTIGRLLLGIGLAIGVDAFLGSYYTYGLESRGGTLPGDELALVIGSAMWVIFIGLTGTYFLLLFPTGRLPSERWRPFAWATAVVLGLIIVAMLFTPGPLTDSGYPDVVNPLGIESLGGPIRALNFALILLPVCMIGGVVALVGRFRRSSGVERLQLKWLVAAGAVVAATFPLAMGTSLAITYFDSSTEVPLAISLLQDLSLFSLPLIPAAALVAILRYRLYDLGLVINRTLVYGSLTALLVGAYLALVFVLQRLLSPVTADSDLAVAGSTLLVAALARPVRRYLQTFIDRRFYRRKYDAEQTLASFTARMRDEVDLNSLGSELTEVVLATMQPSHVSLWLKAQEEPT